VNWKVWGFPSYWDCVKTSAERYQPNPVYLSPVPFLEGAVQTAATRALALYYSFFHVGFALSCQETSCVQY
jgi:hypothetical protein